MGDSAAACAQLLRVYSYFRVEQDYSLLVDIFRQFIVFQGGQDLVRCLRTIGDDPEVVVGRVKNRLNPQNNTKASAEYRDMLVNLHLKTAQTSCARRGTCARSSCCCAGSPRSRCAPLLVGQ